MNEEKIPFGKILDNGELIDNPYEQKILEEVVFLKDKGYSLREIAENLSNMGYKTRKDRLLG